MGRGTLGITGFLMGNPGNPPPMGGTGGAIGTPEREGGREGGREKGVVRKGGRQKGVVREGGRKKGVVMEGGSCEGGRGREGAL